jgi:tetratricopeptide (TPR) repeat protein
MPPTPSIPHGATMHLSARRSGMASEWLLFALLLTIGPAVAGTTSAPPTEPSTEAIAALIARLGDTDFQRRETASAELKAIGPAAVDALLAAAELDRDLEVALRARWLVDTIPLGMPHDLPEVTRLLESYKQRDFATRVRVMHRLLRVDDDAGIEALARIIRLERSPEGSRVAAALLVREWQADNRWWPAIAARATAGLGSSARPAAAFTRAVIELSAAQTPAARDAALAAAATALAHLERTDGDHGPQQEGADEEDEDVDQGRSGADATEVGRIFARTRIAMLLAAGRKDEATAAAKALLAAQWDGVPAAQIPSRTIETLTWGTDLGIPEIVDQIHDARPDLIAANPLLACAAAAAERARGDLGRATALADAAFAAIQAQGGGRNSRLMMQSGLLMARWGCVDWAVRAYTAVLDDPQSLPYEYCYTAILAAEYLHELGREEEAAACLGRLFGPNPPRRDFNVEQQLAQIGRDHRATHARADFFASCAAATRGDAVERRRLLEAALRSLGKDVDSLIALYHLPDNTPDQRSDAVRRINEALRQIENEIQSVPDDTNGYNEYAWLVANTEGDADKATRYSKQSLVKSFDNSSYLDTLAHCRAAAGDLAGAVRWQSLARRHEPHNHTIEKNLERFEAMAAKAAAKP